jgi:hypothetical protein
MLLEEAVIIFFNVVFIFITVIENPVDYLRGQMQMTKVKRVIMKS